MKKTITSFYDYKDNFFNNIKNYNTADDVREKEKTSYAVLNIKAMSQFKAFASGTLTPTASMLLQWFLVEMNFAGDNVYGGQTVLLSPTCREHLCEEFSISKRTLISALNELKDDEIIIKRDAKIYQVNPLLFAKGAASQILALQCYILEKGIAGKNINKVVLTTEQAKAQDNYLKSKKAEKESTEVQEDTEEIKNQYIDDVEEENKKQNIVEFRNKEEQIPIVAERKIGKTLQGFF